MMQRRHHNGGDMQFRNSEEKKKKTLKMTVEERKSIKIPTEFYRGPVNKRIRGNESKTL